MTRFLEWLLGLEHIRLSSGPLNVDLSNAPPAWVMLFGAVLVLILVDVMYRLERGSKRLRMCLASVRALFLFAVLGMVARPNLVLRRDRVDPSVVAVVVDQSGSMSLADTGARRVTATQPAQTRFDLALSALSGKNAQVIKQLAARHRVELWGFSDRAERIDRAAGAQSIERLRASHPDGPATDLVASLDE